MRKNTQEAPDEVMELFFINLQIIVVAGSYQFGVAKGIVAVVINIVVVVAAAVVNVIFRSWIIILVNHWVLTTINFFVIVRNKVSGSMNNRCYNKILRQIDAVVVDVATV